MHGVHVHSGEVKEDPLDVFDAIVVGAGPAGSAAARSLARAGRHVLLLDRADFPRDKPCGDLIGARALALARRLGIDEGTLAPYPSLAGALVTAGGGAVDLTPSTGLGRAVLSGSDARVVPRAVFDAALVRAAERAGAEFRRATVRTVHPWDAGSGTRTVTVATPDGPATYAARVVILAGGYGCRVAPEVAPVAAPNEPPRGIAIRGYFSGVASPPGRIVFCLDRWVLPGYGWIFPLPDGGANVGIGTLASSRSGRADGGTTEHLHELYARFTADPASPVAPWLAGAIPVGAAKTWPLDLGPRRRRLVADGLLVAGEAAAFVGPLTGAGIAFALDTGMRAGETAAGALAAGDLRAQHLAPYARGVRRRLLPWLRTEAATQRWLSDPDHLDRLLAAVRPLPFTGPIGARLLLHLG